MRNFEKIEFDKDSRFEIEKYEFIQNESKKMNSKSDLRALCESIQAIRNGKPVLQGQILKFVFRIK